MIGAAFERIRRGLLQRRWIAVALAAALIAVSVLLAWQAERQSVLDRSRQANVQARILASSVAGALAFDDRDAAREYVNALRLNRDIQAVGVYGAEGELIAGYVRTGEPLPARVQPRSPAIRGLQLSVVAPVTQEQLELGNVYVRALIEPWNQRASRYLGIGAVVAIAAFFIALLGSSYATVATANRRLQEESEARANAEAALRQAQKMEAIGQLTGGVAHDFNNLLMAASSGLELFNRTQDPERREKLKQGIREALDRGAQLTRQLLTFSRRAPLQSEVIDVRARIDSLADLLDRSLREDISVRFDLATDLWPVEVDASQFDLAILNIAVNARDAMSKGGVICIAAHNRPGGLNGRDAVLISIEDPGSGMSADAIEKAFEPFFTTKGVGRGTGLGLSQVYGFTRAAKGTALISSTEGSGTTVTLLLPRCERVPVAAPRKQSGERIPLPDKWRLLVVEDDDALADLIGQMLGELGCEVERAATAEEGFRCFETSSFDAVLSDMVMPGEQDGLDLARALRGRSDGLPILLMTGFSSAGSSAKEEGFEVLWKPFSIDDLASWVREALGDRPAVPS